MQSPIIATGVRCLKNSYGRQWSMSYTPHTQIGLIISSPLAGAAVNVDMIVQNVSPDGKYTDMTFTVPRSDLLRAIETIKSLKELNYKELQTSDTVAKVSVVGVGMKSHSGVANTMFKTLAEKSINIQVISTSEIKISVLIEQDYVELAVRSLHAAYGLEG